MAPLREDDNPCRWCRCADCDPIVAGCPSPCRCHFGCDNPVTVCTEWQLAPPSWPEDWAMVNDDYPLTDREVRHDNATGSDTRPEESPAGSDRIDW